MINLNNLEEGIDWYYDAETGNFIWTKNFLIKRGFCCHGKCKHCPYDEQDLINHKFNKE